MTRAETRITGIDGGWWPPGHGEPGEQWDYERVEIALNFDGTEIDVLMITPEGERGLASFPLGALARLFVEAFA